MESMPMLAPMKLLTLWVFLLACVALWYVHPAIGLGVFAIGGFKFCR